jgi:hypothetical protein
MFRGREASAVRAASPSVHHIGPWFPSLSGEANVTAEWLVRGWCDSCCLRLTHPQRRRTDVKRSNLRASPTARRWHASSCVSAMPRRHGSIRRYNLNRATPPMRPRRPRPVLPDNNLVRREWVPLRESKGWFPTSGVFLGHFPIRDFRIRDRVPASKLAVPLRGLAAPVQVPAPLYRHAWILSARLTLSRRSVHRQEPTALHIHNNTFR